MISLRILVFHQFYRQANGTGGDRVNALVRNWTRRGAEVCVVAGMVDHQSGAVPAAYAGRFAVTETLDGAEVVRTWTIGASKASAAGRISRDLSFATSSALVTAIRRRPPDVILASSPPLFTGLSGMALHRLLRVPLVFDVRDLWPDFAVEFGAISGRPAKLAYAMESSIYSAAARVVVVTPAFRARLLEKGVPASKLDVIQNGADLDMFSAGQPDGSLRHRLGWGDRFVVLYAGVHGPAQALEQVVRAAVELQDDPDILMVFLGDGSEKAALQALARSLGATNVQFLPSVPREEVASYMRAADAGIATLKHIPALSTVYPAKLFDIMACGRPIVLAGEGAAAALVQEARAGVIVAPEQPTELARAIASLAADRNEAQRTGARGNAFVRANYDRRVLADRYLDLLRTVSKESRT